MSKPRERIFDRPLLPPKVGSRRRIVYDMLINQPGVTLTIKWRDLGYTTSNGLTQDMQHLRDYYGMDIRSNNDGTWVCHR